MAMLRSTEILLAMFTESAINTQLPDALSCSGLSIYLSIHGAHDLLLLLQFQASRLVDFRTDDQIKKFHKLAEIKQKGLNLTKNR